MPSRFRVPLALGAAGLLVFSAAAPAAPRRADLKPTAVRGVPATGVLPGTSFQATLPIRNVGRKRAPRTVTALFLSTDRKRSSDDTRLLTIAAKKLRPRRTVRLKPRVKLPASLTPRTYRLIACADLQGKVKERKEGNNCRASRLLTIRPFPGPPLAPPPSPPAPPPPAPPAPVDLGAPSLAFHTDDQRDHGYASDFSSDDEVVAGDVVTLSLRMAAGVPGAAGYDRTTPADEPFVAGAQSGLTFSETDDGQAQVTLPFTMPFAGVPYGTGSVSTNGWFGFGAPARDYWDDWHNIDFRGVSEHTGQFHRGVMPYWGDLDLRQSDTRPAATVNTVDPGDGERLAVQWDVNSHNNIFDPDNEQVEPRRRMQAILFRDGRVRFDYAARATSPNPADKAFVGLSGGNGAGSLDTVAANTLAEPATAVLYTPRPVSSAPAPAGRLSVALPYGSEFVSADAGCTLVTAPTAREDGLVECDTPAIPAGTGTELKVRYKQPANTLTTEVADAANGDHVARWKVAGQELVDADETIPLQGYGDGPITTDVVYSGLPDQEAGEPLEFTVNGQIEDGGKRPTIEITVPEGLSIQSSELTGCAGEPTGTAGGTFDCVLPNGTFFLQEKITFVATSAGSYDVTAELAAENADADADTATVSVVGP